MKLTPHLASLSALVAASAPVDFKQVSRVLPETHAVFAPHLHCAPSQMLLKGAAHASAASHLQTPAVQVSESPLQASAVPHLQVPESQVSEVPLQGSAASHLQTPSLQVSVAPAHPSDDKHSVEITLRKLNFEINKIRNNF